MNSKVNKAYDNEVHKGAYNKVFKIFLLNNERKKIQIRLFILLRPEEKLIDYTLLEFP